MILANHAFKYDLEFPDRQCFSSKQVELFLKQKKTSSTTNASRRIFQFNSWRKASLFFQTWGLWWLPCPKKDSFTQEVTHLLHWFQYLLNFVQFLMQIQGGWWKKDSFTQEVTHLLHWFQYLLNFVQFLMQIQGGWWTSDGEFSLRITAPLMKETGQEQKPTKSFSMYRSTWPMLNQLSFPLANFWTKTSWNTFWEANKW